MLSREMKDSGVEWIGEIPSGWKVTKLRNCLSRPITDGPHETPKYTEEGVPFLSVNAITSDGKINRNIANKISKVDAENYNIKTNLQEGDILFTKSASIGKTAIIDKVDFMVWSPIAVIKTNKIINNKFLDFVFQTDGYLKQVINLGTKNTQVNVGMRAMEQAKVPLPSLRYQGMIVSEISNKTKKINKIIKETEQSIEELKKYKQSLITEVVTKGLDKNVEMKDSGIEWIGEIPKEWETIKGKYLFKKMQREIEVNEIVTAFRDGQVVQRKKRRTDGFTNSLQEHGYQGVRKGDLVIHSMDAFAGAIGVSEDDGKSTPVYIVLDSVKPNLNHEYFSYLMRTYSILGYIESMAKGIRVRSTDFKYDTFANTLLINPPIAEQNKIVEYINRKQKNIDELIDKKIELINEYESYKKSLIYEYVTGKKEVGEEEK